MDTNAKGEFALLKVKLRSLEKNALLSEPTLPSCRYDLIVDYQNCLHRAQVKWADGKQTGSAGSVELNLRKITRGNKQGKLSYLPEDADILLVYVPRIDQVLWLGSSLFHHRQSITIRLEQSKNNQKKGCLMAADYLW